jgi:hypothetical protein
MAAVLDPFGPNKKEDYIPEPTQKNERKDARSPHPNKKQAKGHDKKQDNQSRPSKNAKKK